MTHAERPLSRKRHWKFTSRPSTSRSSHAGTNFTNILQAACLCKSVLKCFYMHTVWICNFFGEENFKKAAHKILLKSTLDVSVAENYSRASTFAPSTRRRSTTCPPTSTSALCAASSTVTSNIFNVTLKPLIQVSSMRVTKTERF